MKEVLRGRLDVLGWKNASKLVAFMHYQRRAVAAVAAMGTFGTQRSVGSIWLPSHALIRLPRATMRCNLTSHGTMPRTRVMGGLSSSRGYNSPYDEGNGDKARSSLCMTLDSPT